MNNEEEEEQYRISPCLVYFALVWMALGMWAFVRSLYCFGRSGSTTEKVVGLLVAWVFGPFAYLILYVTYSLVVLLGRGSHQEH